MRRPRALLGWLAVLSFVSHLPFGLYYATKSEHLIARPSLQSSEEAFLASYPGWNTDYEGDAASYNRAAIEVMRTGVPRTRSGAIFFHAPGYAYFVALCYWIGGIRLLSVAIPQALLNGLTCLLVGLAAERIAPKHKDWAMVIGGVLVLVDLRLAMYVAYVQTTPLLVFLATATLYAASRPPNARSVSAFVLLTVAGIYVQAAYFVVGAAAGAWLLGRGYWQRISIHRIAGWLTVLAVAVKFALGMLNVGGGRNDFLREKARGILWEANNPYYESMTLTSLWERRPGNPWTKWKMSESEQESHDRYLWRTGQNEFKAGLLWVRENPRQYAKLCLIRLRTELGPFTGQMSPRNRIICTFYWLLIFPVGFWALWKNRRQPFAYLAILVILAVVSFDSLVIVEWYLRYRWPVDLLLMIYAATVYGDWADSTVRRLRRQVAFPEAVAPNPMAPPPSTNP